MKFILGKKIEMTQLWQGEKLVAVTKVQAGPCPVVQMKSVKTDGYDAVQLGFGERKEKNIKKPQIGHLNKSKVKSQKSKVNLRYLREFRDQAKDLKAGDIIDVSAFAAGDTVKVTGVSKGKGFQGGVKRHGWHGHNVSHGTKDQVRTSGSIGAGGPQHVFKGTRMSGRMGDDRVTVDNLKIAQVDQGNNILYISGAVPGARNSLLLIYGDGELKAAAPENAKAPEETKEKQEKADTAKTAESVKEKGKAEAMTEPVKIGETEASAAGVKAEEKAEAKNQPAAEIKKNK